MYGKITYLGSRNPWTDRYKILLVGCRLGRKHACQFWWRSVKGFLVWRGVEFLPFLLTCFVAFKTLSHYRASVWWKHMLSVPNVAIALRIYLTLPRNNCEGERSFSTVTRVKSHLRNNMGQERLAAWSLLCIESDVVKRTWLYRTNKRLCPV